MEQGIAARNGLYNLVWPPANKAQLFADFATEEEAKKFFQNGSGQLPETRAKSPTRGAFFLSLSLSSLFFLDVCD
jgi:hypothetical protein